MSGLCLHTTSCQSYLFSAKNVWTRGRSSPRGCRTRESTTSTTWPRWRLWHEPSHPRREIGHRYQNMRYSSIPSLHERSDSESPLKGFAFPMNGIFLICVFTLRVVKVIFFRPRTCKLEVIVFAEDAKPVSPRPAPLGLAGAFDMNHHISSCNWPQIPQHEVLVQSLPPRETWTLRILLTERIYLVSILPHLIHWAFAHTPMWDSLPFVVHVFWRPMPHQKWEIGW